MVSRGPCLHPQSGVPVSLMNGRVTELCDMGKLLSLSVHLFLKSEMKVVCYED